MRAWVAVCLVLAGCGGQMVAADGAADADVVFAMTTDAAVDATPDSAPEACVIPASCQTNADCVCDPGGLCANGVCAHRIPPSDAGTDTAQDSGSPDVACEPPAHLCGATCSSVDPTNCGVCGNTCMTLGGAGVGQCVGSMCACPQGQTLCGSTCTDLTSDPFNCGQCYHNDTAHFQYCFLGTPSDELGTAGNPGQPNDPIVPVCTPSGCTCRNSTANHPCVLTLFSGPGVTPGNVWTCTC